MYGKKGNKRNSHNLLCGGKKESKIGSQKVAETQRQINVWNFSLALAATKDCEERGAVEMKALNPLKNQGPNFKDFTKYKQAQKFFFFSKKCRIRILPGHRIGMCGKGGDIEQRELCRTDSHKTKISLVSDSDFTFNRDWSNYRFITNLHCHEWPLRPHRFKSLSVDTTLGKSYLLHVWTSIFRVNTILKDILIHLSI